MSGENNYEEELPEFSFEPTEENQEESKKVEQTKDGIQKKGYVAIHSSGFRDFLLKPELLKAVVDCGFELPSEVQHQCIPQAILGMDIICQAKSGMGKTAVFVISVLQQLEIVKDRVSCIVLCHTRELAYQIAKEFNRFSKYLPDVKTAVFYGGINVSIHKSQLQNETPNIVVGTPGRVRELVESKYLDISKVRCFILDECDRMLESLSMRTDIQEIFKRTPHDKQVMMFSATLSKEIRPIIKMFMQDPVEIYVDDEKKLTLHGLQQYYIKLKEEEKNKKLTTILDALEYNQVVIFVRSVGRAMDLTKVLEQYGSSPSCIHSKLSQEERIKRYSEFKDFKKRILVSTDLFGRGIDIQGVSIVINYDMPDGADQYLHRAGRAGRFGTKGLAISFITPDKEQRSVTSNRKGSKTYEQKNDEQVLEEIQKRFSVQIKEMPATIDKNSYMTA